MWALDTQPMATSEVRGLQAHGRLGREGLLRHGLRGHGGGEDVLGAADALLPVWLWALQVWHAHHGADAGLRGSDFLFFYFFGFFSVFVLSARNGARN